MKKKFGIVLVWIVLILIALAIFAYTSERVSDAYDKGYAGGSKLASQAYDEGRHYGYNSGYHDGYDDGYNAGTAASDILAKYGLNPEGRPLPSSNAPTTPAQSEVNIDQTVYVTAKGKKYHRDGCQYLSKSKYPISLNEAKAKGLTACSKCWK